MASRTTSSMSASPSAPCPERSEHACTQCGTLTTYTGNETTLGRCFPCDNADNPFLGISCSMEVGAEDSRDPRRIHDGSAHVNVGLPGIDTVVGTRPDGKPRLKYRPISNNEVGTARGLREYAKRNGLEPVHARVKRSIGGK